MTKIRSFALGGLDEAGKSLFVLEVDQDIFVFDCGMKTLKEIDFGVNSLVPDFDYLIKNQHKIKGVFITKINLATAFGLPFMLKKIPSLKIFVSNISQKLLKSSELLTKEQIRDNLYKIDNQPLKFGNVSIHCFYTASDLPGSCGFSLETLDGYIIYTGAFILATSDFEEMFTTQLDKILFNKNKKVLLLITNAGQLAINNFIATKNQIDRFLDDVLFNFEERLFVCCDENEWNKIIQVLQRLEQLEKDKYQISFFDNNFAKKFKKIIQEDFQNQTLIQTISKKTVSEKNNDKKQIIFLTGRQKWLFSRILGLISNQKETEKLTAKDYVWILGENQFVGELTVFKTLNELYKTDVKIKFTGKRQVSTMEAGFEDVKLLINFLKPTYLFPVNAYHKDLENAKKFAKTTHLQATNIFIQENGEVVTIENKKHSKHYQGIHTRSVFVDNNLNDNVTEKVIKKRKILSGEGMLLVIFSYSLKKDEYFINSELKVKHFGITKDEQQTNKIKNNINECVQKVLQEKKQFSKSPEMLKVILEKQISLIIKKITRKLPIITVSINFIN